MKLEKCEKRRNKAHALSLTMLVTASILSISSVAQASSTSLHQTPPKQEKLASKESENTASMACDKVSVQVLGSGGPELDDGRTSSAYLVWVDNKARVLVDAGSGSSVQFGAAGASFETLDVILLSHLHTDHSADLPSFVKGGYFTNREKNLWVMGPDGNETMPSTNAYVSSLIGEEGAFRYLSSYTIEGQDDYTISTKSVANATLEKPFEYAVNNDISVEAMSVNHGPIPTLAWKVKANGCEAVFSGDTNDKEGNLSRFAKNADILVLHNAIDDNAGRVAKNLHMTPTQIIDIAEQSKAKRIVLSHIMKRSESGLDALTEAISVVAEGRVYAAQELMNIELLDDN
ncbi:MBL fold metallo-hydrolase [Alteromonas sp. HB246098]